MPRKAASTTEDAFLQTILENPDDDLPRLVFADWLEEQGNPRGTFIRLQCQRAKLPPHDPVWKELLAQEAPILRQFETEWSKPALRCVDEVQYRRGFIEHVRVSATKLLKNADRLFRLAPVCSLRLEHADRLPDIAARPWLARIVEFDLSRNPLGSKSLQTLLHSEHCRSLRVLRLNHCGLYSASAPVLANASNLRSLETLTLADNAFGEDGARDLARSPHLTHLRELNLHANQLLTAGAVALCAQPTFRLTKLSLGDNRIGNDGAAAIARCSQLAELRHLDLENNAIGNLGVEALVQSPYLQRVEFLNFNNNHISGRGVQLLTDSQLLTNLTCLYLKNNEIDKATLQTVPNRLRTANTRELLF